MSEKLLSQALSIDQGSRIMTIHYTRPEQSPVPHGEDQEV